MFVLIARCVWWWTISQASCVGHRHLWPPVFDLHKQVTSGVCKGWPMTYQMWLMMAHPPSQAMWVTPQSSRPQHFTSGCCLRCTQPTRCQPQRWKLNTFDTFCPKIHMKGDF